MTDREVENMMKVCECQVGELLYVVAGKDCARSAELLDEMAERLQIMARNDRERARKRPGRVTR